MNNINNIINEKQETDLDKSDIEKNDLNSKIFCRDKIKEINRQKIKNDKIWEEINEAGYILDEVFYGKEEGVNTLRLVIDKQGYININDCLKVNDIVNPILDKEDPISESYVLDVCSKEKGGDGDGQ